MLRTYSSINLQDVFKTALYDLMTEGMIASPRGMETREFVPAVFEVKNPRSRFITLESRRMNPFYGIIETLWYLNGDNNVERLVPYNKAMAKFSDDGKTLSGAYGARLIKKNQDLNKSQFGLVYDKLKEDPSSRQAVSIIWDPWRDYAKTKDVPCTIGFIFTIRENKLNMTTIMRSNDIVLGTTYDVFAFTIFQEFLARKLGVGLGTYTHLANSFHVYEMHYNKAWEMIRDNTPAALMPEMPETSWKMFESLYSFEELVRESTKKKEYVSFDDDWLEQAKTFGEYWSDWAYMIVLYWAYTKRKEGSSTQNIARKAYSLLHPTYQIMTKKWINKLDTV